MHWFVSVNVSVPIRHQRLQAVMMFDNMVKEVLDQVGGLSSQNTELCSTLRNILQVVLLLMYISNGTISTLQICGMSTFSEKNCSPFIPK